MEHKCPWCGGKLPESAAFCPHCAQFVRPREEAAMPSPRRKNVLVGLLLLAAVITLGAGLWLAVSPKTYDGSGEVCYGDYQILPSQSADRYTPSPTVSLPGEPEGQYRNPARLFVNSRDGQDAWEAFLEEVETVSATFVGQEDSLSPMACSQPAYNPGVPDSPLVSLIDFTGKSGTAELVWTFQMKNGDTIRLRQSYEITPIPMYDYYPEEYPMDTPEELQALLDRISGQVEEVAVVNLHLPAVTYEEGITIRDRSLNLYGSTDADGNRTTFTGPVQVLTPYSSITYFYDMDFVGGGVGVQLDNVPTDVKLNFQGSVFRGNQMSIDNRCSQPTDLSQAILD